MTEIISVICFDKDSYFFAISKELWQIMRHWIASYVVSTVIWARGSIEGFNVSRLSFRGSGMPKALHRHLASSKWTDPLFLLG